MGAAFPNPKFVSDITCKFSRRCGDLRNRHRNILQSDAQPLTKYMVYLAYSFTHWNVLRQYRIHIGSYNQFSTWIFEILETRLHYSDVTMSAMASHITGVSMVCSAVVQLQIKENIQAPPLAFLRRIHWSPVDSPHKGPVRRKTFPFDDVIMSYIVSSIKAASLREGLRS